MKISWFNLYLYSACYNCNFALIFRRNQQWIKFVNQWTSEPVSLVCVRNIFSKKTVLRHILPFKFEFHIADAERLIFVFQIHPLIFWFSNHSLSKAHHVQTMLLLSSDLSLTFNWPCMYESQAVFPGNSVKFDSCTFTLQSNWIVLLDNISTW